MASGGPRIHLGTSGFGYEEWRPAFYPEDLPKEAMLPFYAERLRAVELNNTFYRMPRKDTVAKWRAQVPDDFVFAVKATQKLTWTLKLVDCGPTLAHLFEVIAPLGSALGCVFFQVPKWVRKDTAVLRDFLALLPAGGKFAFEFAHASWLEDDALAALRDRDAAVVASEREGEPPPALLDTARWGYLRLRKLDYTDAELQAWRERLDASGRGEWFLFFKHEEDPERALTQAKIDRWKAAFAS